MKKAIVVGATSGIGRALAVILADNGYRVGITGRRGQLLLELQAQKPESFVVSDFDITNIVKVPQHLDKLKDELNGLDLLIISSGTGAINPMLETGTERYTADVNVAGFTTVAGWAFNFFQLQGSGHLAAITSIAGFRGSRQAPAYFASKAYQINYLEGLQQKAANLKLPIFVADVRPGFVDTAMATGDGLFWVSPVEKAAKQIFKALENKRAVVYITKRWRLIAFLLRHIPSFLYKRL